MFEANVEVIRSLKSRDCLRIRYLVLQEQNIFAKLCSRECLGYPYLFTFSEGSFL